MPESAAQHVPQENISRQWSFPAHIPGKRQKSRFIKVQSKISIGSGPYYIQHHPGSNISTVRIPNKGSCTGLWTASDDVQSDGVEKLIRGGEQESYVYAMLESMGLAGHDFAYENWLNREVNDSADEGFSEPVAIETNSDDVMQWSSGQLVEAILHPEAESDMARLREMILVAEDTGFTSEQSKKLSPWLLDFAKNNRDSNDHQDEAIVWSALRTGASMLSPADADQLLPLLEPDSKIDTSLVAVKMIGRIFEAQPPSDVNRHPALSKAVSKMAVGLLNPYVLIASRSAAMAHLAIYALAAMAGTETHRTIKVVLGLNVAWFTRRTLRKLCQLRDIWNGRSVPVSDGTGALLDDLIEMFGDN